MTIETIIMKNNWLGREAELATWEGIKNYFSFSSIYREEENKTIISFKILD